MSATATSGTRPNVGDGKAAFVASFEGRQADYPDKRVESKRALAEGGCAVLHRRQTWPDRPDHAGLDVVRCDARGNVVERWDALQVVPEVAASPLI